MNYNQNMAEDLAVLGFTAPVSQAAGTVTVGPFYAGNLRRVLANLLLGSLGAAGTVNAKWQAAATQGGAYADVAGSAITQISAGASNYVQNELKAETLAAAGQGPWLQFVVTVGANAVLMATEVLGSVGRFGPSSDYNVVTPAQTVVN